MLIAHCSLLRGKPVTEMEAKFLTPFVFVSLRLPETTTCYVLCISQYLYSCKGTCKGYQRPNFNLTFMEPKNRIDSRESILPAYVVGLEFLTNLWALGTEEE